MIPINIAALRTKEDSKIFDGSEKLTITDIAIEKLNSIHVLTLSRKRSEQKLGFLIVHTQRYNSLNDLETPSNNLPCSSDIRNSESKIITKGEKYVIYGGEGSRYKLYKWIIPKNKELHRTRIALFNPCGKQDRLKKKIPETNNTLRSTMEGSN